MLTFDSDRHVWDSVIELLGNMGWFQPSALSLIWVSIKTAEPAAQTATRQSELWRWFDRAESAGCVKTQGLFSCHALPQGYHIEEVQLWCVVTSPHTPDTQLLIPMSDQKQEISTVKSMPLSLCFIPLIGVEWTLPWLFYPLTLSVLCCSCLNDCCCSWL